MNSTSVVLDLPVLPESVSRFINPWRTPEIGLGEVVRWSIYHKKTPGQVRTQTTLQHSLSITILVSILVPEMNKYDAMIDFALLLSAFAIHDVPEGILNRDILYGRKTAEKDLEEYLAFRKRYESLGASYFQPLHIAYLLQFASANPACFPEEARSIMSSLANRHPSTVIAFEAIERWDYILYALEQYRDHQNGMILFQVLRDQCPHLKRLAEKLPGLRQVVFTREFEDWSDAFLIRFAGNWDI